MADPECEVTARLLDNEDEISIAGDKEGKQSSNVSVKHRKLNLGW